MSCITEGSTGYPGGNGNIPFENGFLSEILLQHGYNTYALGKWHLTPADQISAAGPYDRWPLGRGFERFYGFLGGETHQYYPELVWNNHTVEAEKTPEEGYHLTEDLVDKAISFIADAKQVAPNKPFFMIILPGRSSRAASRAGRNGPTNTRANLMTAGTSCAKGHWRARKNWVLFRPTLSFHATIPMCRSGSRCLPRKRNFMPA